MKLICDNSKAKELLNWQPSYSLDRGLENTIEYIKENMDLYKAELYNL